jgi:phospholipid/cholesterol/gamma-HCH transport system ATP-binding protein
MEQKESNAPVIEASAVQVLSAWTRRVELTDVDWKVLPGESWVIGGRHGSGKTDLLLTMAGLHRPGAGSVRLFGRETSQLSQAELLRERTRIGFVFKDGGRMFNELTVAENIALPLCYHHNWSPAQAENEVHEILKMTDLTSLAHETAQRLGAGWRQRVGLARALALKPQVLFLDEPTSGLEVDHHQWSRDFFGQLSKQKITVVATTNDFAFWQGDYHRFALIKDGRLQIVADLAGPPQDQLNTTYFTKTSFIKK